MSHDFGAAGWLIGFNCCLRSYLISRGHVSSASDGDPNLVSRLAVAATLASSSSSSLRNNCKARGEAGGIWGIK